MIFESCHSYTQTDPPTNIVVVITLQNDHIWFACIVLLTLLKLKALHCNISGRAGSDNLGRHYLSGL